MLQRQRLRFACRMWQKSWCKRKNKKINNSHQQIHVFYSLFFNVNPTTLLQNTCHKNGHQNGDHGIIFFLPLPLPPNPPSKSNPNFLSLSKKNIILYVYELIDYIYFNTLKSFLIHNLFLYFRSTFTTKKFDYSSFDSALI